MPRNMSQKKGWKPKYPRDRELSKMELIPYEEQPNVALYKLLTSDDFIDVKILKRSHDIMSGMLPTTYAHMVAGLVTKRNPKVYQNQLKIGARTNFVRLYRLFRPFLVKRKQRKDLDKTRQRVPNIPTRLI